MYSTITERNRANPFPPFEVGDEMEIWYAGAFQTAKIASRRTEHEGWVYDIDHGGRRDNYVEAIHLDSYVRQAKVMRGQAINYVALGKTAAGWIMLWQIPADRERAVAAVHRNNYTNVERVDLLACKVMWEGDHKITSHGHFYTIAPEEPAEIIESRKIPTYRVPK